MDSSAEPAERGDRRRMFVAIMIAAILVCASAVFYIWYSRNQAATLSDKEAIVLGDIVKLDYTGYTLEGRVFDTSILSVAFDDVHYPKSLTFNLRNNDSYKPIDDLTAGETGSYIEGFSKGVLGMHVNETRLVEVPVGEGYALNPSMVKTIDILQELPGTESYSASDFSSLFGVEPILFRTVPHFFWHWDVLVVDNSSGYVTIKHQPVVGQVVYPFGDPFDSEDPQGWAVVVEAYDAAGYEGTGITTVRHQISADDVYNLKGTDIDDSTFILSGYDQANGTFQVHYSNSESGYNGELSGRIIFFEVTILKITHLES